jgi:hypothetical protein
VSIKIWPSETFEIPTTLTREEAVGCLAAHVDVCAWLITLLLESLHLGRTDRAMKKPLISQGLSIFW